jgi:HD-like signal output (HDOD) protein
VADDLNKAVLAYIKTMPSLPVTVTKVLEICGDPQASPVDLSRVISLDPVLVARIIKLINSAYYGLDRRLTSLARAIIMLGINTVKNMVLSTAITANLSPAKSVPGLNMDEFWKHSLGVAVTAKYIAKKRGVDAKDREEYFTAALLHDIGKIPINAVLSPEYTKIIESAGKDGVSLYVAETRRIAVNHCKAGGILAEAWHLQGAVGEVMAWHHSCLEYNGPNKDILFTVAAANRFAFVMNIGFAGDRHPEPLAPELAAHLGIDETLIAEIEPVVNNEIEKASFFLKL